MFCVLLQKNETFSRSFPFFIKVLLGLISHQKLKKTGKSGTLFKRAGKTGMFWTGHRKKGKAVCTHLLYSYTLFYTAASVHCIQLKKLLRIICLSLAYRKSFQVRLVRDGFWPECLCKAWRELMGADSQLLATITSLAWSAVTLSSLAKKDERLDPWTGNIPHHYHTTVAKWVYRCP